MAQEPPFEVWKMYSSGGITMRRATNPTRKISITIPESIFNRLDRQLGYTQSRSAFISDAIKVKLDGFYEETVKEASTRSLMIHLKNRDDIDDTMKALLLQILSQ